MKFQPDQLAGTNRITGIDAQALRVNGEPQAGNLIVPWTGRVLPWQAIDLAGLVPADFEALVALGPEVVIFGSGSRLRFPAPALYRSLIERRIGLETMDTGAACRTFNVLASEGRRVVAALLVEAAAVAG